MNLIGDALGVRDVDLEAGIIDLNEGRKTNLVMALLWLVEAESVVNRWHRRYHIQCLRH